MKPWLAYCDGSAVPNPGRMGLGAVLTQPDGTRYTLSQLAGEIGCNNEAEVKALTASLKELKRKGATTLLIYCDNSVVVEQVNGTAKKPIARLACFFDEARTLLRSFDHATLTWVPRHRNEEADALARAALGLAQKRAVKPPKRRR